jgi:hypothetical protein
MRSTRLHQCLLLVCIAVAACSSQTDTQRISATIASHEAVLQELPRDFYKPGLGDQMHAVQLRHAKLWFAGSAENWDLAAFELEEINETLERIARWHADNKEVPMPSSIKAYTQVGRYALDQSIRQRDAPNFPAAFDQLTEGCNECHRAAHHGFIVIQRPTQDPVGNQSWALQVR